MNFTKRVSLHNYNTSEDFLDFLKLSYKPSKETAEQCLLLLPIAIAEDRLLSSLRNTLLREAMEIWNKPPAEHYFYYSPSTGRWTFKGTEYPRALSKVRGAKAHIVGLHGRLKQPIIRGQFCFPPGACMIQQYSGFNVPAEGA